MPYVKLYKTMYKTKCGGLVKWVIYGRIGEKNFTGLVDGITHFCTVGGAKVLGHRDAAMLRICCDAQDKQIYDIDVSLYIGDRYNSGCIASVTPVTEFDTQTVIKMLGRRIGLTPKESTRARHLVVKYTDYLGFSEDSTVLALWDNSASTLDMLVKLRLRDIYTLRLNNITERVANCLLDVNDVIAQKVDVKWAWTKKLICMAALECLLRVLNLWDNEVVRDETRNEAVIKLMLGDLLFDGIEGLDEYNMYSKDAKQRVTDSELLYRCGKWLVEEGGQDVAASLRATDIPEKALADWKKLLEEELGVVLPALTKHGEMRRPKIQRVAALYA